MSDIPSNDELAEMLPGLGAVDVAQVEHEVRSWQALADVLRLVPEHPRTRMMKMAHPAADDRYTPETVARMVEVGCFAAAELFTPDDDLVATLEADSRPCLIEGVIAVTNLLNWLFRHLSADWDEHVEMAERCGYGIPHPTTKEGPTDEQPET